MSFVQTSKLLVYASLEVICLKHKINPYPTLTSPPKSQLGNHDNWHAGSKHIHKYFGEPTNNLLLAQKCFLKFPIFGHKVMFPFQYQTLCNVHIRSCLFIVRNDIQHWQSHSDPFSEAIIIQHTNVFFLPFTRALQNNCKGWVQNYPELTLIFLKQYLENWVVLRFTNNFTSFCHRSAARRHTAGRASRCSWQDIQQ